MATRHRIGEVEELEEDGDRAFAQIDGVEVAVFRINGELFAMANYCVHQGGPLCEGDLRGRYDIGDDSWEWTFDPQKKNVICPWHGWKFDVTTGVVYVLR
jgi:nitrite reductase/ring-hydroxylating ferredoxin subunit